jgi:glycosyltransferase involved in cell wall biosynthesis
MNICLVTIEYPSADTGGGLGTYVQTTARRLASLGHRVVVVAPGENQRCTYENEGGVTVHYVKLGSLHYYLSKIPLVGPFLSLPVRQIEWGWSLWKKVRQLQIESPFDVVEGPELGNFFNVRFLKQVTVIIRTHGSTYYFKKASGEAISLGHWLDRKVEVGILRRASGISVPSQFKASEVRRCLADPDQKIAVIPNPVPFALFHNPDESLPAAPPFVQSTSALVLYTGRLASVKGVLILLEAAADIVRAVPGTNFVLAGRIHNSIPMANIRKKINELELGNCLVTTGHLSASELKRYYYQADVFVMPSYYETFCISCIEAMAAGIPVVATWAGGLPEVVKNGKTGILVPPGSAPELARAIIRLLRDPELRTCMGRAGRERVFKKYTVEHVAAQTLALYQKVIKQN